VFEDKIVLITGGTGSFGRWVTKELLKYNPQEIRIYSRDEEKQLDMEREFQDKRLRFITGDVRDFNRLLEATQDAEIIYHAAALKIIPACEVHPVETLKTNTIGTWNVKNAAIANKVPKSVLVSTDKAVKPVNLYGMTKAIAEKIWANEEFKTDCRFAVVRYGNVIGSRGSVVPFFSQLIKEKKPLPITDRSMTRFLVTLQQAADLVFFATENMNGGEIFVPDLPACNIVDLAKAMGGKDYPLKFLGIRPGEKLHECLIQEDEFRRTEKKGKYYVIHPYMRYESKIIKEEFTSENATRLNTPGILDLLKESGWA
jgi:UDP-N-acetylglucosamine 4,6-dehydratase